MHLLLQENARQFGSRSHAKTAEGITGCSARLMEQVAKWTVDGDLQASKMCSSCPPGLSERGMALQPLSLAKFILFVEHRPKGDAKAFWKWRSAWNVGVAALAKPSRDCRLNTYATSSPTFVCLVLNLPQLPLRNSTPMLFAAHLSSTWKAEYPKTASH